MKVTEATVLVLNAFLSTHCQLSGADVARQTGLMSGTLYPILHRLEANGLLIAKYEVVDPKAVGRPRRILYELTADAATDARNIVRNSRWATMSGAPKHA